MVDRYNADHVFILGDLTDSKDRHSSQLVNRLHYNYTWLRDQVPGDVWLLMGNHDYTDPKNPFFGFLPTFFSSLTFLRFGRMRIACVPHWSDTRGHWRPLEAVQEYDPHYVFCHHTFKGAVSASGTRLQGLHRRLFSARCSVISGDVHVPQDVGNVTYTGSPYPIHFGDTFLPRVLLVEGKKRVRSIERSTVRKVHAVIRKTSDLEEYRLDPGDHLRVTYRMKASSVGKWYQRRKKIEAFAKKRKVYLHAVTFEDDAPELKRDLFNKGTQWTSRKEVFAQFCKSQEVSFTLRQFGHRIMRSNP